MNLNIAASTLAPSRACLERRFAAHDRTQLFFRHWPAASEKPRGALLLFHRGHEHSGRVAHLVDELDMPDFAFYAWDQRGHGLSRGQAETTQIFADRVRDIDDFTRFIAQEDGVAIEDMAIVAQSVGAALAAAFAHDYAPRLRALCLAAPAFDIKLYVPFARPALALMHRLRGDFLVNSYVKPRFLTHDESRIVSYEADPLITRPIPVKMLLGLYEAGERVVREAAAITIPTQLLVSGADWVVRQAPQHEFFVNLGARTKERHVLEGFFHDTLGEKNRAEAVAKARSFLLARFDEPREEASLLDADVTGFTRREADALATPVSIASLKGAYWAMTRASLRLGALLSGGLEAGRRTGFDSGSMLDYVYRDTPQGFSGLGRLIDRLYLDAIGWRGIRVRKQNVEELLALAMRRLADAGTPVRVMDVAAGYGRYVLDALARSEASPERVLLRDFSDVNVAAGRALIAERGLAERASFVKGDAFDADSLAAVEPKPTLGVVSGLYELFPDNARVRRSLSGLARAIPPGGYLVYTCQPWHPQLELIARALTSHREGQAWVMRRRTQNEMDQLVAEAGFDKIEQRIDEWGIFTVALARRREA